MNVIKTLVITELAEQKKQLFLWSPVFLAMGIAVYFSLPFEPPFIAGVCAAVVAMALTIFLKGNGRAVGILLCLLSAGFLSGQMRTHLVHTPILQNELGPTMVTGTVDVVEVMGEDVGTRLTLSNLEIEKLEPAQTPVKIRLRLRKDPGIFVGQRISALSHLNVPSSPVIPGGFDFQRYLYFKQIGAVGFIYKKIDVLNSDDVHSLTRITETLRSAIVREAERYVEYPQAGVAMALMMGRKTAIASSDSEAMRGAGLAHILAISGLHIGLFSGVLFFFSRLLMVSIPLFALKYPVKKYAAVIGIAGAFVYMMLAGATVPTQRAFLMTSIVFIAIIFDRSPISLRLVAFAAFVVLLLFPESLLSASFHMSFAAVISLVVFYDRIRRFWSALYARAGVWRRIGLYVLGVCMTTMVASLATAPFALFHFQQIALYSLLGNIAAMPIMAFVIMPGIVATLLLMPFNLDFLGFFILDFGVTAMLTIAHWVADLPYAVMLQPVWPLSALVCLVFGALILFLFKTQARLIFVGLILASIFIIYFYKQPDILISSNFKLIGMRLEDGGFIVSNRRSERFSRENWVRSFGMEDGEEGKWPREYAEISGEPFTCDEQACRYELKGYKLSYIKDPAAQPAECNHADLVLSEQPLDDCNAPHMIDFFDTHRHGAHAIWLNEGAPIIKASENLRGNRPWSRLNGAFNR